MIGFGIGFFGFAMPTISRRVGDQYFEVASGMEYFVDKVTATLFDFFLGRIFSKTYSESNSMSVYSFYIALILIGLALIVLSMISSGEKFNDKPYKTGAAEGKKRRVADEGVSDS